MAASKTPQLDDDRPSKEVVWYDPDIESNIRPEMRDLLVNYSKIPAEEMVAHIDKVVRQPLQMMSSILLTTVTAPNCVGYMPLSYHWLAPFP